jgi:hypothetical protein
MPTTAPQYRLVIFDEVDEPEPVRDLVARVTGTHPTDAMQWIAKAPGVWPRPLPEKETRELLDGLYELGVAAEAWRTDRFPELTPPRNVHRAACLKEGFRVQGLRGEPTHWVPWDNFDLISVGRIAAEDEFRTLAPPRGWPSAVLTGLRALKFRRLGLAARRARAQRTSRDPVGEVILVRREPLIAFRVVENQMNYSYLGDRLSPSAAENFPVFVAELRGRANQAELTPATRAFLEKRDPSKYEFPDSQTLLDYTTLRLLWSWYRRDRDADLSAER